MDGTKRRIQGMPAPDTEPSPFSEITGTWVRPDTCKMRWVIDPLGGEMRSVEESSKTKRAVSSAALPH